MERRSELAFRTQRGRPRGPQKQKHVVWTFIMITGPVTTVLYVN